MIITVGGSVSDSTSLISSFQASGAVTYTFFASGTCTGSGTLVSTLTATNGVVPSSMSHGFNSVGSFSWNLTYAGDTNNNVASTCEALTVVQASPTLATVIKDPTSTAITSSKIGNCCSQHCYSDKQSPARWQSDLRDLQQQCLYSSRNNSINRDGDGWRCPRFCSDDTFVCRLLQLPGMIRW